MGYKMWTLVTLRHLYICGIFYVYATFICTWPSSMWSKVKNCVPHQDISRKTLK